MTTAVIAAVLLASGAGTATRVIDLGPSAADLERADPRLAFSFAARADEEITEATLRIVYARGGAARPPRGGVEVVVNEERVALLSPDVVAGASHHDVAVPRELLAPRNQLQVRLLVNADGTCAPAPGAWRAVEHLRLTLATTPVPLPDDLALLPLPFFDRDVDAAAVVPLVLGDTSPERVRTAAAVARWLSVDAPIPVEFEAVVDGLPDGRAIVLVAGAAEAARIGAPPPAGPEVRMMDHPAHPGSNAKLLVVAGRDAAELHEAAERLPSGGAPLVGDAVQLERRAPPPADRPGSAPRWVPTERAVPLGEYPGPKVLAHEGTSPATLSVRFRVPPDLWLWPAEFVTVDLGWSERLPRGAAPPRLDVEMNGFFLATLPRADGAGTHARRVRLRVPRAHLRGFNELRIHVRHADADPCAAAGANDTSRDGDAPRVEIAGDSVLHFEGLQRFAVQPDVALFAFDGYPFTQLADLAGTAVVLPSAPSARELSVLLSVLGRFAQVTGRARTAATFLPAGAPDAALAGKDLLVVSAAGGAPLLTRWAAQLPFTFEGDRIRLRRSGDVRAQLELLGGLGPLLDARRASEVTAVAAAPSAIVAIESPLSAGRTAVFITAGTAANLPPFREFLGYAESRGGGGDVLLHAGDGRWMFRLGRTYGRGELDAWTEVRWFLATHWIALVPLLIAGVLLLAFDAGRFASDRMRSRLAAQEGA